MFGHLAILVHLHWAGVCCWLNMLDLVAAQSFEKSPRFLPGLLLPQTLVSNTLFSPWHPLFSPGTSQ